MEIDEDSLKEKLLPENNSQNNKSESESQKNTGNMSSAKTLKESEKKTSLDEGDLRLHDAVFEGDLDEIENLVNDEPKLVFERDSDGRTPLHTLALAGEEQATEIAKILLGVNESEDDSSLISIDRPEILNLQDAENCTALHVAARGRQPELVSALLRWGANPTIQDKKGNTCLHLVAEGNTEKAVEVATILISQDKKKVLINSVNHNEQSPLHMAIGRKALKMVNFLLQPENKFDLSAKNGMGRSCIHFASSATGESDNNSCEILKSLLQKCNETQLNQADLKGRTALHLATLKRFPKMVKILCDDERVNVTLTDHKGRTALHYACEDGCYTKGSKCVEVLVDRKFNKYFDQVQYLFKMEDNEKNTAFMYACINCPAETMKHYTGLCPKPQYWLSSVYMTLIYKNCPSALKPLMDKAFTEDQNEMDEDEDGIKTDFGIITGYVDPVDVMPQQETKYLKQALWWDYDSQREILLHPLTQYFLMKKWQLIKRIILFWIAIQIAWLIGYTIVGLTFYTIPSGSGNSSSNNPPEEGIGGSSKILACIGSVIMLFYMLGSFVNEIFEACTIGTAYILSFTNFLQVAQMVLGCFVIVPVFAGYDRPEDWMKYTTACGVLIAYLLILRDIGKLNSEVGWIIEGLKQVIIQILKVMLCCLPLLLGFTVAFMILFNDEASLNSDFPGPIVKVLVMMTGEFEYNDTFKNDNEGAKSIWSDWSKIDRVARLIFFLSFLIFIPVGFFNLLTGIALDKVLELREKVEVARVSKQLEHIYFIESIVLSCRWLRKLISHVTVVRRIRKWNVTSQWFNTEAGRELKFETFIKETIRKSERKLKLGKKFRNKLASMTSRICQPVLSPEVMERIYALASPVNAQTLH